jgi:O-antigen/teichoic acid export membrane protein
MARLRVNEVLLSGSFWTTVGEVVVNGLTLVTGIIAARVLPKRDFGLMGTALLALSVLDSLSNTGFDAALIQKKEKVEEYLDIAWTWLLVRGGFITLALCAAAPFISAWYGEAELLPLIMLCSLQAIILGAHNIGPIHFTRNLEFKTLFIIKVVHILLKLLLYIPAIFYFRNVWALVVGHLGGAAVGIIVSYVAHPYRPKLAWDWKRLKELISYGKWITGLAVIGYVIAKGDDVFVSKYLGMAALAVYQLSYDVSNMPTINITHVIGRIGFPTYARLQDDKPQLRATFIKMMRVTLMISGPVSVFVWVSAPDLVNHILGSKWAEAVPLIRILVISGFIRSFAALAGPIFQATGRPDLDFKMNFPRFLCVALLVYPFAVWWGIEGICWVVTIAIATCTPTWIWGINNLLGVRIRDVLRENVLAFISTVLLGLCYWGVRSQLGPDLLGAILAILGALVAWLAGLFVIGRLTPWDFFDEIRRFRAAMKKPDDDGGDDEEPMKASA